MIIARIWSTWVSAARQSNPPRILSLPLVEAPPGGQSAGPMKLHSGETVLRLHLCDQELPYTLISLYTDGGCVTITDVMC